MRNWRDWFIPPSEEDECSASERARFESGTGHRDIIPKQKAQPRCARCKEVMGYEDGMYVMLTAEWRVHISCFAEVLRRHFEDGESIDFETGRIVTVEVED